MHKGVVGVTSSSVARRETSQIPLGTLVFFYGDQQVILADVDIEHLPSSGPWCGPPGDGRGWPVGTLAVRGLVHSWLHSMQSGQECG